MVFFRVYIVLRSACEFVGRPTACSHHGGPCWFDWLEQEARSQSGSCSVLGGGGRFSGHSSIKSAPRMNRAVMLFLAKVEQVNKRVETGITVGGQFIQVTPLTQPAPRITLSNVLPFISDEFWGK